MQYSVFIKYRKVWMALAILWIVFFHMNITFHPGILEQIKWSGYGGVDIFIFASGIGCYYSLKKNNNPILFLKRRVIRLMPTYWTFISVWIIYKFLCGEMNIPAAIGNFWGIQAFTGNGNYFNWYISAIWLLYFMAPYIFSLMEKIEKKVQFLLAVALLIVISVSFWNAKSLGYIITATRVPIFSLECMWQKIRL